MFQSKTACAILAALVLFPLRSYADPSIDSVPKAQAVSADIGYQAAYCRSVLISKKSALEELMHSPLVDPKVSALSADANNRLIAEIDGDLNKIQAYIASKISDDQSEKFTSGEQQGVNDISEQNDPKVHQCTQRCVFSVGKLEDLSKFGACADQCSSALTRMNKCNDLSWLPE